MNPTLREPEMMEVVPYHNRPVRVGDVVFFIPSGTQQPVVHRVARVTPAGIATLGDNNPQEDTDLLQPQDIAGQAVAVWRGQQRRKIAGGWQGQLTRRWLHWRRVPIHRAFHMLHPLYDALSRSGLIAGLLPAQFRPRAVVFHSQGRDQFRLLLGHHIIGRYDDQRHRWQIKRPFRVFVDERALQRQQDEDRTGSGACLVLADGSRCVIAAGDEAAIPIVSDLAGAMQLRAMSPSAALEPPHHDIDRRLLVVVDADNPRARLAACQAPSPLDGDGVVVCVLRSIAYSIGRHIHLLALSSVVTQDAQTRGGVLLHGALAETDGIGVILAAPSRTGKTTASNRLTAPWHSLCDDTTLVVRDAQGHYWAHPWPTWSRFQEGESGGSWDVQAAVPLKGIFFLSQAVEDRVESVGPGQAASLLVECAGQTSQLMTRDLSKEGTRDLNLERFTNLCALARIVPAHVLHISLTGAFWQQIEQTLKGSPRGNSGSAASEAQSEMGL